MGFLFADASTTQPERDTELLHKLECKACPLNTMVGGKMAPTGAKQPLVYILGEAPGADEVDAQEQFVGQSGQLLRSRIPEEMEGKLRWNNVVRTRPPRNKTPERTEIECCRPSVVRDIEATKPKAIFGFGNVPLNWISGFSVITGWRGRRMPVKVGNHVCWYYPMLHPSYLLRQRRGNSEIGSEDERMFVKDLEVAFAEVTDLPEPTFHSPEDARAGVEVLVKFGKEGKRLLERVLGEANQEKALGVDYETTCLRPYSKGAKILSAGISWGDRSFAFPIDHPSAEWTEDERDWVLDTWFAFLRETKAIKVVHNLAFDLEWSGVHGGREQVRAGRWEDTSAQAAILDERRGKSKPGCFSLAFLVQQYFGFNLKKLSNVDRSNLSNTDLKRTLEYNAMDAKYHLLLWQEQRREIKAQGLEYPYELALRRVPTVVLSQMKGVPVNQAEVKKLDAKYAARITKLEQDITELAVVKAFRKQEGRDFSPFSNPDVLGIFNKMLHCRECVVVDKYTKKERLSTDESVLSKIKGKGEPLAKALLALRKANKAKSTYIDPLKTGSEIIYPDGLIHAQFNTIFAETGRLSCNDPNLQNFPKRGAEAKEVRKPIQAPKGHVILAVDYGQIEARVIAMFTKDKAFCKSLWERYDVHMEWAERIARAYPERIKGKQNLTDKKIMKDFRTDVKNQWTFPLFFGASPMSAAGYLKIPENVVRPLYREFWKQFAGVKDWQETQIDFYNKYGYVECLTGRRRRGPLSVNKVLNSPIQGTAAEIVMDAMCRLSELNDWELQPEINIHDDLTWVRVPEKKVEQIAEKIITVMLDVPFDWVNVPITVEASVGDNWMEMDEFGAFSSDEWNT